MALQKLVYRAGLNREGTNYSNEGGWYDGDKIRFRSGQPEKIGGWIQLSAAQYLGVARSLWTWFDADGLTAYISLGTNIKYYIYSGGAYNDITPIYRTDGTALSSPNTLPASPISTQNLSNVVTLTDPNYQPNVGDYITISSTASVGGLTISGNYRINSITSSTTFTISTVNAATSTATGGGTVVFQYEYPAGLDTATTGSGWGAGPWSYTVPVNLGSNPLASTSGSVVIKVIQANHGLSTGNWVYISGATAIGGIPASDINTNFTVTVVDANSYTVTTQGIATSTAPSGGGLNVVIYPQNGTVGWGNPATTGAISQQLRLWTQDNYGADLVIAPRGGPIYYWQDINSVSTRAVSLSSLATPNGNNPVFVPTQTFQVLTSSVQQFIIAMGSNSYNGGTLSTTFNPMLVRWSDQANPTQWVPSVTNQSGEYVLTNGSYIMTSTATRQENLIWTDSCLYSMQYIGYPYVFSFQVLMDNISILSPNSVVTVANVTYWMGKGKFYMYAGTVQTLPCELRQYIFADINLTQSFQIFAGANEAFNEVWWFYVSNESTNNTVDKYVIYNYLDKVWAYGTMARTAWLQYGINPSPVAADYNRRLLYHEVGTDDVSTATPQPIVSYIQSSDFGIEAGDHLGFVWRMLPDINFNGSTVNQPSVTMTLYSRLNSGAPYVPSDIDTVKSANNYQMQSEYTIEQYTGQVYTRLRGRQMAFQIKSSALGVTWQLGTPRIDLKPAGRR